ncbi:MAG: transporter [Gemmatimonadales bacterium]|nr:transporter [Gemmatimonadales bacterium]
MKLFVVAVLLALVSVVPAYAHHGVASLGVAGLEGSGAPVESSSSATLPDGSWLATLKLDLALFDTFTAARDDEGHSNAFWIYGLGYGVTPAVSLYAFVPYSVKKVEDNSFNSAGFADISLMGVLGLKTDGGLKLVPANESLDDLEDWHFTLYGGLTLPTGEADLADAGGTIDPGMSLGFGTPSYQGGMTATKTLGPKLTMVWDTSWIGFQENEYSDGSLMRFGDEWRLNNAWTMRMFTREQGKVRVDANLEGNFLSLGRDRADSVNEDATGGKMLYVLPGMRAYFGSSSLGLGWKMPVWTDLNEEDLQQGAEGKETGRFIMTWSTLF